MGLSAFEKIERRLMAAVAKANAAVRASAAGTPARVEARKLQRAADAALKAHRRG